MESTVLRSYTIRCNQHVHDSTICLEWSLAYSIVGTFTFTYTQQASLDTPFLEQLIRLRHEHQEHYMVGLYAVYIGNLKKQ